MAKRIESVRLAIYLLGAAAPGALFGQELLVNGNFESQQAGPWEVSVVDGSSGSVVSANSPFNDVYGPGSKAFRLGDDDSDFLAPTLSQSFTPAQGLFFSFDFKVLAENVGSAWYLAWEGEDATTAFFFSVGGGDALSLELNQAVIAPLRGNSWYHVQGWADAPSQRVEGFFTNDRGERADFQSGFPFGVKDHLERLTVSDGAADPNQPILLDNFSSRLVSLEMSRDAQGRQVLSWGGSTNFLLQATAALGPGAQWATITSAHGIYTNSFAGSAQFFRLIHQ